MSLTAGHHLKNAGHVEWLSDGLPRYITHHCRCNVYRVTMNGRRQLVSDHRLVSGGMGVGKVHQTHDK